MQISKTFKAAPTGLAVAARANKMVITRDRSTDRNFSHWELRRYLSADDAALDEQILTGGGEILVGGGAVLTTVARHDKKFEKLVDLRITDNDALVDGQTYHYAAFEYDKYGNRSEVTATVNAVYRLVEANDVAPNAIVPSKQIPRDYTNLIRDGEMSEPDLWTIVNGSVPTQEINAIGGAGQYQLVFTRDNTSDVYVRSEANIPVEQGIYYRFIWYYSAISSPSSNFSIYSVVDWYNYDSFGELSLISTSSTLMDTLSGEDKFSDVVSAPSGAQAARSSIRFVNVANAAAEFKVSSPQVRRQVAIADYQASSVGEAALAATAYTRSRILGTVSQSAGVPTGAIIEAGSNANGYYTKFADGTMICRFVDAGTLNADEATGAIYRSDSFGTWTFPEEFVNTDDLVLSGSVDNANRWVSFGSVDASSCIYRHISPIQSTTTPVTRLQAVGRWF